MATRSEKACFEKNGRREHLAGRTCLCQNVSALILRPSASKNSLCFLCLFVAIILILLSCLKSFVSFCAFSRLNKFVLIRVHSWLNFQRNLRLKKSIKCAPTSTPKTAESKNSLLLFSHRVTRIGNREPRTFFTSIAQVRPTIGTPKLRSRNYDTTWGILPWFDKSISVLIPCPSVKI